MSEELEWTTMEELMEVAADTEAEDRILDRVKLVAQESLPEGWLNWKTLDFSKEALFGTELTVDPQILNKLRFALPTVALARAFNPSAVDLPEKQYRDLKVSMLNWSFCRALIMSPPALVNKLKGSVGRAEIFLHAIESVKPLCISRKRAAELLRPQGADSDSDEENDSSRALKRPGEHLSQDAPGPKRSKVTELQDEMRHMFGIVMEKIQNMEQRGHRRGVEEMSEDDDYSDNDSEHSGDSSESVLPGQDWTPPAFEEPSVVSGTPVTPVNDLEALSFAPQVKEKEPTIPPPAENIKAQGIQCQKFGSSGWSRIRYKEVQKKLQASPVFDSLKVNTQLEGIVSKSYYQTLLERVDELTGTLSHGLLKQRQKLMEGMKSLAAKHPGAYEDIKATFVGESEFKEVSDDLLQFTCARRAEVIEMRRKAFKPKEQHHAAKLAEIPPSESHLYDEELLSKFLDQRGGLSKVFPPAQKPYKERFSNHGTTKDKPAQKSSGFGHSSYQKQRSQPASRAPFRRSDSKESRKDYKKTDYRKSDSGKGNRKSTSRRA